MRIKKILLSSTLLTLLFFTSAYGKGQEYQHSKPTQDTKTMKFGSKSKLNVATIRDGESAPEPDKQDTKTMKFGSKSKLNVATIRDGKSVPEPDEYVGMPSFDLFGEYALNDVVGIQLALGYSGQGSTSGYSGYRYRSRADKIADKIKIDMYLHYIMLSAVPRFYPGSDRQFCLFIGPRVSWLASAKNQVFSNDKKLGKAIDLLGDKKKEENKPKRIDWGVLLGLDYEFDAGIILGLDWNFGITNVFKDESITASTYSLGLTLGYNFAKLFN